MLFFSLYQGYDWLIQWVVFYSILKGVCIVCVVQQVGVEEMYYEYSLKKDFLELNEFLFLLEFIY